MSGSCGWAKKDRREEHRSISRMATPAAIWASPPSGPLSSSPTSRPTLSRMSRAVWRVAMSGNAAEGIAVERRPCHEVHLLVVVRDQGQLLDHV